MWENKASYNGLSVLPYDNGNYKQPPFEDITPERFKELEEALHSIDLSNVYEPDDATACTNPMMPPTCKPKRPVPVGLV